MQLSMRPTQYQNWGRKSAQLNGKASSCTTPQPRMMSTTLIELLVDVGKETTGTLFTSDAEKEKGYSNN